jgi:probable rRNA maturation factor
VAGWAAACLRAAGRGKGTLSVLLCGDGRMRTLNRVWRKQDRPTDVLSFPSGETGPSAFAGDVAIDVPYAKRQARKLGHSLEREVQVLLAHGVLHLLGHDHETDDGAMFALQRTLVRKVFGPGPDGLPPPVGGRTP